MKKSMERGAGIVIRNWMKLKPWEKLLIVTNEDHMEEARALKYSAQKRSASVSLMIVEKKGRHVGVFFDENETIFDGYNAIIAATSYSLVTTKAAKRAIKRGSKFLSLPLHTNDRRSMLSYSFMAMDTKKSKLMAKVIMNHLNSASVVHITTKAGTDLKMYKRNRPAGFFNGVVKDGKGFSSASIEAYVPIEEDMTEGIMILDGSLGYIGKVNEPFAVRFEKGRIVDIADSPEGRKLKEYMEEFHDPGIYVAGELGIGLNSLSRCEGNCYIEDESAYGTFHIGVGRNIALGGKHEANGHFDLVVHDPDIYVDNRKIMEKGKIIAPVPEIH